MSPEILRKTQVAAKLAGYKEVIAITSILVGSLMLALCAQIAFPLPFSPVPITLQSFGIALLAMVLGPRYATLAVLTYLVEATAGLPVLAGGIPKPFWMISPTAGYLVGFALSAYLTGKLLEKYPQLSFAKTWALFSINELTILTCGTIGLSFIIGLENALWIGAAPFIPGALLKITVAAAAKRPVDWIKSLLK
jgi:biotin transport system substrate-specific component